MHEYIYYYRMLTGTSFVTMYLTHKIRKNKVNVALEFLFLFHANDGDCCGCFGNTVTE